MPLHSRPSTLAIHLCNYISMPLRSSWFVSYSSLFTLQYLMGIFCCCYLDDSSRASLVSYDSPQQFSIVAVSLLVFTSSFDHLTLSCPGRMFGPLAPLLFLKDPPFYIWHLSDLLGWLGYFMALLLVHLCRNLEHLQFFFLYSYASWFEAWAILSYIHSSLSVIFRGIWECLYL